MSDSADNLLDSGNAAGLAKATSVTLSGANTDTAAQATALAALRSFSLQTGATLTVADSATNLLATGNAPGVAAATTVSLIGTANSVSAAQATTLANFATALASGATLAVSDSAADLLAAGNVTGIAIATTLSLTGPNTVSAVQATTLVGMAGFGLAALATLVVADSATNLLNDSYATGLAEATAVTLTGTANTVTAAQAIALERLTNFTVGSGATLVIADNATNLLLEGQAPGYHRVADRDQPGQRRPGVSPGVSVPFHAGGPCNTCGGRRRRQPAGAERPRRHRRGDGSGADRYRQRGRAN